MRHRRWWPDPPSASADWHPGWPRRGDRAPWRARCGRPPQPACGFADCHKNAQPSSIRAQRARRDGTSPSPTVVPATCPRIGCCVLSVTRTASQCGPCIHDSPISQSWVCSPQALRCTRYTWATTSSPTSMPSASAWPLIDRIVPSTCFRLPPWQRDWKSRQRQRSLRASCGARTSTTEPAPHPASSATSTLGTTAARSSCSRLGPTTFALNSKCALGEVPSGVDHDVDAHVSCVKDR